VRQSRHKDLFKELLPSKAKLDVLQLKIFKHRDERGRIAGMLSIGNTISKIHSIFLEIEGQFFKNGISIVSFL
jgi:hypothetical protein